jgi:hypothetical protein
MPLSRRLTAESLTGKAVRGGCRLEAAMRQARWLAMAPWVVPLVAVLLLAITLPARAASPAAGDAAGRSASSRCAPR